MALTPMSVCTFKLNAANHFVKFLGDSIRDGAKRLSAYALSKGADRDQTPAKKSSFVTF